MHAYGVTKLPLLAFSLGNVCIIELLSQLKGFDRPQEDRVALSCASSSSLLLCSPDFR